MRRDQCAQVNAVQEETRQGYAALPEAEASALQQVRVISVLGLAP